MVCILETKQKDDNYHSLKRKLKLHHFDFVAADGLFEGIFVGWKDDFVVTSLVKNQNFVYFVGTFFNTLHQIIFVYGNRDLQSRIHLWDTLVRIGRHNYLPWIV